MQRSRALVIAVLAGAAAAALPVGSASAAMTGTETLLLDSQRKPADGVSSDSARTDETLAAGDYHLAVVRGTFSHWAKNLWERDRTPCETPDRKPVFSSPGMPDGPVGQDAFFVFARPPGFHCPVPYAWNGFQVDLGSGHFVPTPRGGMPSAPPGDNVYRLLLVGEDQRASFRLLDTNTADNYGMLEIEVRPATSGDCAGDQACLEAVARRTSVPNTEPSRQPQLPVTRICKSRRNFDIRIRHMPRDPAVAASVRVNGRQVPVRKVRGRLTARVDLRGLPRGRYRVDLTARTRSGKRLRGVRRYRACTTRHFPGRVPPL